MEKRILQPKFITFAKTKQLEEILLKKFPLTKHGLLILNLAESVSFSCMSFLVVFSSRLERTRTVCKCIQWQPDHA
jgi:hypothetical protein